MGPSIRDRGILSYTFDFEVRIVFSCNWQLSDYRIQEHCVEEELPPKKIKKEVLVIVAQVNGNLCGFLELCSQKFRPNLAAIAQQDMPAGTGRKGGTPTRKKRKQTTIETTSTSPFFESTVNDDSGTPTSSSIVPSVLGTPTFQSFVPPSMINISSASSCTVIGSGTSTFSPSVPTCTNSVANNTNFLMSFQFDPPASMNQSAINPFILKLKSPRVHVCQTLFSGSDLVIPDDVKFSLTVIQKEYLLSCIQVPQSLLN